MKILFISNIPSPYRVDFFNELGKKVDLTVLFEAKRAHGINFDWNDNYLNFKTIFLSEGEIQERKYNFQILKEIKKDKYDVIFATNYSYRTELIAYLKMVFCKIPFVLEIDGGILKPESKLLYLVKRFMLTKPITIMSPSYKSDDFLKHYGVNEKKIYRYAFSSLWEKDIVPQILSEEEKNRIKMEKGYGDVPVILCVSQVIHRKGIDILINALNQIQDEYSCVIIGERPDDNYFNEVNREKNDKTFFVDFKSKDELKQYYLMADFFVLPTRFDVWGLVVNEALANGLPVITTTSCVAGTELIIDGENGFLIEKENMNILSEKIQFLLKEKAYRQKMSQVALKSIGDYTIEKMVENHVDFLSL